MALQRPPRPGLSHETSMELTLLARFDELDTKIDTVITRVREQTAMLVGTADGPVELPHGRLVRLESRELNHESRISALEANDVRAGAYWSSARLVGHILTGLFGGAIAVAGEIIVKLVLK